MNECLGIDSSFYLDGLLSRSCSVQLRYGRSNVNFRIYHCALRDDAKQFVPEAWDGVRSILYVEDISLSTEDREAGLSVRDCLKIITKIAHANHCEMVTDLVVGEDDSDQGFLKDTYGQEGFRFPTGDGQHAVKHLNTAESVGEKLYCGALEDERRAIVTVSGQPLPLGLELDNSSPTGFGWGYGGAGAFQLAVAITRDLYGAQGVWEKIGGAATPAFMAIQQLITELPFGKPWALTASEIRQYVDRYNVLSESHSQYLQ